jgi:hypothetical protein
MTTSSQHNFASDRSESVTWRDCLIRKVTRTNDHIRMTYMQVGKVDLAHGGCEFACKFIEFNSGRSSGVCSMQSPSLNAMFHNVDINVGAS